jgi:phosphomannomutase
VLGVERDSGRLRFFPGDLVGMIVAEYLGADAVVVPITCNDGIDRGPLAPALEPKTRIGSPWVVAGMEEARRKGRRVVCGWEANGGFLTGSDIEHGSRVLPALPTRDAMLPIVATLAAVRGAGVDLLELFGRLPRRFGRAALIREFPRAASTAIMERFSDVAAVGELGRVFDALGPIESLDYTDGVRMRFASGDVVQFRPSGNADEMRIYAYADTQERVDEIAAIGVAEPDGLLRRLQRSAV